MLVASALVVGCGGGSGLKGTLEWKGEPRRSGTQVRGTVHNTTSHSVHLDPHGMRLLDSGGRKVRARFRVGDERVEAGAETSVRASWRNGDPTRLDYGAGTLQLPSG